MSNAMLQQQNNLLCTVREDDKMHFSSSRVEGKHPQRDCFVVLIVCSAATAQTSEIVFSSVVLRLLFFFDNFIRQS